jgi:hypothetical protein
MSDLQIFLRIQREIKFIENLLHDCKAGHESGCKGCEDQYEAIKALTALARIYMF